MSQARKARARTVWRRLYIALLIWAGLSPALAQTPQSAIPEGPLGDAIRLAFVGMEGFSPSF